MGQQPGGLGCRCQTILCLVAAAAYTIGDVCQQCIQALIQVQAAADFQLQTIFPPTVQGRGDAVSPAAQLLQSALFSLFIPLKQLYGQGVGQCSQCRSAHARADAQSGTTIVDPDHALLRHYRYRLVFGLA